MDISRSVRSAGSGRVVARQGNPCPGSDRCAKQTELSTINVPTGDVDPGDGISIAIELINHVGEARPFLFGSDGCAQGSNSCNVGTCGNTNGLCTIVHVDPEWTEGENTPAPVCSCAAFFGERQLVVDVPLPAPNQEGDFTIDVWLELTGSGQMTSKVSEVVSFQEGGQQGCTSDAECPAGKECMNGTCRPRDDNGGNGGNDTTNTIQQLTVLVGLLIVAVVAFRFLGDD